MEITFNKIIETGWLHPMASNISYKPKQYLFNFF